MIKKTVKRGLAFTLAASLAFGAAPVAGFAAPTIAEAAESGNAYSPAKSVSVNVDATKDFGLDGFVSTLSGFVGATKAVIKSNDKDVALISTDGTNFKESAEVTADDIGTVAPKFNSITVKGVKAGTTSITIVAIDNNEKEIPNSSQTIDINVSAIEKSVVVKDAKGNALEDGSSISMINGKTAKVSLTETNTTEALTVKDAYDVTGIYVEDTSIATAAIADKEITFTGHKFGQTNVYLFYKNDGIRRSFVLSVAEDTQLNVTLASGSYTIGQDKKWTQDKKVVDAPVIYLNNQAKSAQISASATNGNEVAFSTDDTNIVVGKDGSVSAKVGDDGKVAPGNATVTFGVPATEGAEMSELKGLTVKVVLTAEPVKVSSLEVKDAAGVSYGKVEGKFSVVGTTITGEDVTKASTSSLKLSLKDKTSEAFTIDSNVDAGKYVNMTAAPAGIVSIKDNVITAEKKGTATITVAAGVDETSVAAATLTFTVEVSDKNINNEISAEPISVNKDKLSDTIVPSATYGNKFSFPTLARPATAKDSDAAQKIGFVDLNTTGEGRDDCDIIVNTLTGAVTYKDNGKSGVAYVKVTGEATAEAEAPNPIYVKVTYGDYNKKASDLSVAANKLSITEGASISAGASSSQVLSYASDDESIATVAADGTITGIAPGTAIITISAAADDVFEAGEKTVTVIVSAKTKLANTIKVTGKTASVKYSKKKAKTLAASKVVTVKKAQGSVTYKKTKGNAKITIAKSGKVTIKKGLKKGTYTVKVKVTAAGNESYKAGSKTVSFKIKVK
ncbi:MAG: Ig-like domain-containing protein [Eubacterium sp.]|nr:Ig-like domain-containing protein [Eubacterium sp.]